MAVKLVVMSSNWIRNNGLSCGDYNIVVDVKDNSLGARELNLYVTFCRGKGVSIFHIFNHEIQEIYK